MTTTFWESPRYIDHHVVRVYKDETCKELMLVLFWGDDILYAESKSSLTQIFLTKDRSGWVKGILKTTEKPPLALAFIDVGQGDSCLITTPDQKRILIDGGENQLAARYLAKRYSHESEKGENVLFDAVIVTHGDADHFAGLSKLILDSAEDERPGKSIRFATKNLFHNGLVKRPSGNPESLMLGPTIKNTDGRLLCIGLVEDPSTLPNTELNQHFKRWKTSIEALKGRHSINISRLDHTRNNYLSFIEDIGIEILGPRTIKTEDGTFALPFLGGTSASKTINGHSVTLKLTYGFAKIILTGDLTKESSDELVSLKNKKELDLQAEILKVPHHGSDDYSIEFLKEVSPTISIISAGDENELRDHLHPRANVLGALGNAGKGDCPLIFITNLSAFDKYSGPAFRAVENSKKELVPDLGKGSFFARERIVYGIVHVRTDGKQIFVARFGSNNKREEYAFQLSADAEPKSITVEIL